MKRTLLYIFTFASLLFSVLKAEAQVFDGYPADSTTISFTDTMSNYIADTSTVPLWQIGHSYKTFFGVDSTGVTTIMTDTLNPYPVNSNNWFVMKIPDYLNVIVDFWHKFQTDSGHDGGAVEFSVDSGMTWQNVKGDCNADGTGAWPGVLTDNFYSAIDTITSGEPSFSGIQNSLLHSRVQFFTALPERTTGGAGCSFWASSIYLRFRFVSDSVADSLAGWIIDSIEIEADNYPGLVRTVNKSSLTVYPNPSADGTFNFPVLFDEELCRTVVYDAMGRQVVSMPYAHALDMDGYAKGVYIYKVSDGVNYYMGQLVVE